MLLSDEMLNERTGKNKFEKYNITINILVNNKVTFYLIFKVMSIYIYYLINTN